MQGKIQEMFVVQIRGIYQSTNDALLLQTNLGTYVPTYLDCRSQVSQDLKGKLDLNVEEGCLMQDSNGEAPMRVVMTI